MQKQTIFTISLKKVVKKIVKIALFLKYESNSVSASETKELYVIDTKKSRR